MREEKVKRVREITARVYRSGEVVPDDRSLWDDSTPEERILTVWELALTCLAWEGAGAPRFRDLLAEFTARGVEFLIVEAHALAAHGHVRATRDLDVWIAPTRGNAAKVMDALKAFGDDLIQPGVVFQIGVAPVRIDILTAIDGVDFDEAWRERFQPRFGDLQVSVLSRKHLIQNKRAAGRPRDRGDLDWLESDGAEDP